MSASSFTIFIPDFGPPHFLVFYWRTAFGLLLSILLPRWFLSCGNLKLPRPCLDSLASSPFAEASSLTWNPSHMAFLCLTSCCMTSFHCRLWLCMNMLSCTSLCFPTLSWSVSPALSARQIPSLSFNLLFRHKVLNSSLTLQIVKLLFLRVSVSLTYFYCSCPGVVQLLFYMSDFHLNCVHRPCVIHICNSSI